MGRPNHHWAAAGWALPAALGLLLAASGLADAADPRWGAGLAGRCEQAAQRTGSSCSHVPPVPAGSAPRPGVQNCTEHFLEQDTDHFSWTLPPPGTPKSFKQRYFINDQYWRKPDATGKGAGPIFFYCGNEANVELYVNATGPHPALQLLTPPPST